MSPRGFVVSLLLAVAVTLNLQAGNLLTFVPKTQAIAATRTFTSAWDIREFIKTIPGITHIPGPIPDHMSGAPRNDQVTANAICQFAGYQTAQITAAGSYHSCGDNTIGYWNGSNFIIYGACNYNNFINGLVCSNPLQCQDGTDNDGDGATDYPADFSCSSGTDADETNPKAACQDGTDNDGDGLIDHPADLGCTSKQDNDESGGTMPQCNDGTDNDGDGHIDYLGDLGCGSLTDTNESDDIGGATPIIACPTGSVTEFINVPVSTYRASSAVPFQGYGYDPATVSLSLKPNDRIFLTSFAVGQQNPGKHTTDDAIDIAGPLGNVSNQYHHPSCGYLIPQVAPLEVTSKFLSGSESGPITTSAQIGYRDVCGVFYGHTPYYLSIGRCTVTATQCNDGIDNDFDGATDYPADFSCSSATDPDETNPKSQCQDNTDNDGDGQTDFPLDLGCTSRQDNDESGGASSNQCLTGQFNAANGALTAQGWTPLDPGANQSVTGPFTENGVTYIRLTDNSTARGMRTEYTAIPDSALADRDWTLEMKARILASDSHIYPALTGMNMLIASPAGKYASIYIDTTKFGPIGPSTTQYEYGRTVNRNTTDGFHVYQIVYRRNGAGVNDDTFDVTFDGQVVIANVNRNEIWNSGINGQNINGITFGIGSSPGTGTMDVAYVTFRNTENSCSTQCSDGIDNDGDGATDTADFSCSSSGDNDETNPKAACQDGLDNDGDGLVDFPLDLGCTSRQDNDESGGGPTAQCQDGLDNDGDGLTDLADPGCSGPTDTNEGDDTCVAANVLVYSLQPAGSSPAYESENGTLTQQLRNLGFTVTFRNRQSQPNITQSFLSQYNAVWFFNGCGGATGIPSSTELNAIRDYYLAGGNLVLTVDDDSGDSAALGSCQNRVNAISMNLGVQFSGHPYHGTPDLSAGVCQPVSSTHPIFTNAAKVFRYSDALLSFTNSVTWGNTLPVSAGTLTVDGQNALAVTPAAGGHGRVIFDPAYGSFSNGCSTGPQLMRNAFGFLGLKPVCSTNAQCGDGIDNDGDGATDMADFSCSSSTDNDETNPKAACQDGTDNDGDGLVDFPLDLGCTSRQDNDESGGGGGTASCQEGSQVMSSVYSVINGSTDFFSLNQSRTSAYCNGTDILLAGAGTGPSCDNSSSPACNLDMHYEFNSFTAQGSQLGWTANYSVPGDAFYDTVRAEARCVPNTPTTNKYFSTYVRTTGAISDYYSLNQNKTTAYCDPGDTAIHGGGTNVFCDGPGNGGCGKQMLEFNGRIIDGNREGWTTHYSMIGDATYDTIQTTVVCLKKTALFDQALKVYHVVNEASPVDYYSLNQNRTEALCNVGDIVIGGGGNPAYCDNASNPACNRIQYLEYNHSVGVSGRQGWRTSYDLGGDAIYDTQRVAATCLGLANSCGGGGTTQCNDGIDNDGDGATDTADFSCSSSTDNDETNPKAACQDGFDNDGDGQIDFPNDAGCASRQDNDETGGGSGNAQCNDGIDNDGDGLVDISDPGCHTDFNRFNVSSYNPLGTSEASNASKGTCADGIDNNGNILIDAFDPICHTDGNAANNASFDPNRNETTTTVNQCGDGIDNDGDGATDTADFSCSSSTDNDETNPKAACQDGFDNDGDGQIDFPNDTGCTSRQDNDETGGSTGGGNADLSITLTGPSTVTKGGTVIYTSTVQNLGPNTATNITVTDPPPGFTFLPAQSSATCSQVGNTVQCTLASLSSGSSQVFTLAFSTQNSACNISVTNIATVTSSNPDPTSANNQSQSTVTFVSCSGTGAQCSDGQDNDGDTLIDNADPDCHTDGNAQNPASFDGNRTEHTNNSGQQCRNGRDDDNDGLIDAYDPDCHTDGNASNSSSYDGTRTENSSNTTDTCLDITIEDDRDPAEPGDIVEYEITIENDCSTSKTFTLRALLDNDMEFDDASGNGDDINDDEVQWQNVTIAAGDDKDFTLEVELDDDLDDGDEVELEVIAGGSSEEESTDIGEDTYGGTTGGTGGSGAGQLSVSKTSDRTTAQPGDTVVYSLTIRNSGGKAVQGVTIEDQFNAGQLSILDPAGGSVNGSTLRWSIDRVDANTTRTLRYTARISTSMSHGDVVQNNVRVSGGNANVTNDSNVIRIIQNLPQTGLNGSTLRGQSGYLQPVPTQRANEASSLGLLSILSLLATIGSGVGVGALAARKFLI